MKRMIFVAIILCALFIGEAFAKEMNSLSGIGLYGNLAGSGSSAFGGGIGATLKFGNFPVLGIEYNFGQTARVGVSCDYWVLNSHLTGALNYYIGIGGYAGLGLGANGGIDAGGRIPIGIQMYPLQKLELFAEIAPTVPLFPTIGIGYSIRIGLRVNF